MFIFRLILHKHQHHLAMMWKLLFLFFAVSAAFEDNDVYEPDSYNPECMERIYNECDMEIVGNPNAEFPTNKEELQESCKSIKEYMACVMNILDNCNPTEEMAKPFNTFNNVFTKVCDEESQLFQVITENLECVSDSLRYISQPCPLSPSKTQDLNDLVNLFSAADEDAFENAEICMERLKEIGCGLSKLGNRCGNDAVGAAIELLELVDKPFERCGPGVKENLALVVDILDAEEELAEELEEMKRKKKK